MKFQSNTNLFKKSASLMKERVLFISLVVSVLVNTLFIAFLIFALLQIDRVVTALKMCIGTAPTNSSFLVGHPPSVVPRSYNSSFALYLARLLHSFERNPRSFHPPQGFALRTFLLPSHIGCVLVDEEKRLWILFRGTQSADEMRMNFQFEQKEGVHKGFTEQFHAFSPQIRKLANETNVIVVGHSLGAALAALAMTVLGDKAIGYAFGSPRVGNKRFNDNLKNKTFYSILNTNDIVTNLPPAVSPNFRDPGNPFVFEHAGTLINFAANWGSWIANHLLTIYEDYLIGQESRH